MLQQITIGEIDFQNLLSNGEFCEVIEEINTAANNLNAFTGNKSHLRKSFLFIGNNQNEMEMLACAIGKNLDREIYKVGLSSVVSKYVGETTKNLEQLFTEAENRYWILFFDEADSLFGKRNDAGNTQSKFETPEIDYLLQHLERYNGIAILALADENSIDKSCLRRFSTVINFPS